jgi:hypothetical protein
MPSIPVKTITFSAFKPITPSGKFPSPGLEFSDHSVLPIVITRRNAGSVRLKRSPPVHYTRGVQRSTNIFSPARWEGLIIPKTDAAEKSVRSGAQRSEGSRGQA